MITQLKIHGFRRLKDIELEMGSLAVLIGANGVGKTSILDAVTLIMESAAGRLSDYVMANGGFSSILTGDAAITEMAFALRSPFRHGDGGDDGSEFFDYSFELRGKGHGYFVSRERLVADGEHYTEPYVYIDGKYPHIAYGHGARTEYAVSDKLNQSETFFSDVQMPYTPKVKDHFSYGVFKSSRLNMVGEISKPQQLGPALSPGAVGESLASFLYNLREAHPDEYAEYESVLKAVFPGFQGLSFPSVANGMLAIGWREKGITGMLTANQLSEGILRFMWLAAILSNPFLPRVVLIDEPEISLHPELLQVLVALMRNASQRSQIMVATQSDRLVGHLDASEVVVMDREENGFSSVVSAARLDLDEWLEEYSLGSLWRRGVLGGRS